MPYVKIEDVIGYDLYAVPKTSGQLNNLISKLLSSYINAHGISYTNISAAIAAANDAAEECRRRLLNKYEDVLARSISRDDPYDLLDIRLRDLLIELEEDSNHGVN